MLVEKLNVFCAFSIYFCALSHYTNYADIELIKVTINEDSYSCWGDTYEFLLIYDNGENFIGFLNIEESIPFKSKGDFNFWLKDINGELVYSLLFNDNVKRGKKLLTEFITNNFTKEEIKKVSEK